MTPVLAASLRGIRDDFMGGSQDIENSLRIAIKQAVVACSAIREDPNPNNAYKIRKALLTDSIKTTLSGDLGKIHQESSANV
jgi:hypothetical protein